MNYDPKILSNLIYERGTFQRSRRSSNGNNDPDFHAIVLSSQKNILRNILHPTVMKRLVNSSLYGNEYMPQEVLNDLNSAIFIDDENPDSFKRNLQSAYVDLLINGFKEAPYDDISKSAIFFTLKEISTFTRENRFKSEHYDYLYFLVSKVFEE